MGKEKRRYDPEFKATVAFEAIRGRFSIGELSQRYDVHPSLIHSWRKKVQESACTLIAQAETEVEVRREKEREIERLNMENEWLQKVLQRLSPEQRREAVEMENPPLSVLRQVKLLNVSRSGIYYRKKHKAKDGDEDGSDDREHDPCLDMR